MLSCPGLLFQFVFFQEFQRAKSLLSPASENREFLSFEVKRQIWEVTFSSSSLFLDLSFHPGFFFFFFWVHSQFCSLEIERCWWSWTAGNQEKEKQKNLPLSSTRQRSQNQLMCLGEENKHFNRSFVETSPWSIWVFSEKEITKEDPFLLPSPLSLHYNDVYTFTLFSA